MMKHISSAVVVACLLSSPAFAQDAKTVIANASKAIGADSVNSLALQGSGVTFGSASNADSRTTLNDYRRAIDFQQPALRTTAAQGSFNQMVTPAEQNWAAQLEIWATPWGFLRGAAANTATVETRRLGGERVHVVSWNAPFKAPNGQAYRVVGYISGRTFQLDAVETWVSEPTGETHVKFFYGNWQEAAGGVKFPATTVQHRGGRPAFESQIVSAQVNPANIRDLIGAATPTNARGDGRGAPAPGGATAPGQSRPTGL